MSLRETPEANELVEAAYDITHRRDVVLRWSDSRGEHLIVGISLPDKTLFRYFLNEQPVRDEELPPTAGSQEVVAVLIDLPYTESAL